MVKAQSLLYAIYVCLILSLLCGALLYIANMYNQLNIFYNTREDLYFHNQSLINYALANPDKTAIENDSEEIVQSAYEVKPYGLFSLLVAKSFTATDTITSAHFTASAITDQTCIFLPNLDSKPLSYSGDVKLIGKKMLPLDNIKTIYIDNKPSKLENKGSTTTSAASLPEISESIKKSFEGFSAKTVLLKEAPQINGVYYNSFHQPAINITLESAILDITARGNMVISSPDSIIVKSSAKLTDVILRAPKIIFEDNFTGTLQAFASEKIVVGSNVMLGYPSSVCMYNTSLEKSSILIKSNSSIYGTLLLYGNNTIDIDKNSIAIEKDAIIACDIYCTGKLILKSNVYGSIYTNKFVHTTASTGYDNCLADVEINPSKRPLYFMSVPLLTTEKKSYAAIKKLM